MPQLELSTFASQLFWLTITFGLLYFTLARYSLPRVREVLQSRQDRIRGDLDKAEELKQQAETIETEYKEALKKARSEAADRVAKTKESLKEEAEARHAKLDEMFARQNRETEQRIKQMRKEAGESLADTTEELVASITKKLIGIDVTKAQAQKARAENTRKAS